MRLLSLAAFSVLLFVALTVPLVAHALHHGLADRAGRLRHPIAATAPSMQTLFFDQQLEHFHTYANSNAPTFKQRYYRSFDLCAGGVAAGCKGAVLYVGGEGALTAAAVANGQQATIAQQHSFALYGLEHRFYGVSHPFQQLTTDNLRYLSSEMALEDLANFITSVLLVDLPTVGDNVVTVGGSYPGALSGWARLKFPHLVRASLASSGPVLANADFYQYDQHVAASAGQTCAQALHSATVEIEKRIQSPSTRDSTKALFGCQTVQDDVSFLYVVADMVAFAIQYTSTNANSGYRYHIKDRLCNAMTAATTADAQVAAYANYTTWLLNVRNDQAENWDLESAQVRSLSWTEDSNMRQWMWQSCAEFGYFQTAPQSGFSLRSTRITLDYFFGVCKVLFGEDVQPRIAFTNRNYGSTHAHSSHVVHTSGSVDPWTELCLVQPVSSCATQVPILIQGTSHCADLSPPSADDPPSLTAARSMTQSLISSWLQNPCLEECPTPPPSPVVLTSMQM